MNGTFRADRSRQRGVALISSILLLLIITILALSMFRAIGTEERIAGNTRDKERALHAALGAQQYGEWWLLQGNNALVGNAIACGATVDANLGAGQICSNLPVNVTQLPWPIATLYTPQDMGIAGLTAALAGDYVYALRPGFYITDLGTAADGLGETYQVDAYGYGSSANSVSVVESVYEVAQGMGCLNCSQ